MDDSPTLSRRLRFTIGFLGVLTFLFTLWPTYRAFLNIEIDINESWNAYFADAAMGRGPLYPSRDLFITNNYPPLSFYLVGAVGKLIGDTVLAGRLLSILGLLLCAVGVAVAVKQLGGTWIAGLVGALFFSATMARFFTIYVGMNDPHLIAQAVMTWGFVGFLRAFHQEKGYLLHILVMVAAGFMKHNLFVMPFTAMIWLGLHRFRTMVLLGLVAILVTLIGFGLCYLAFGPDFFHNLMAPRTYTLKHAIGAIGHLQWIAVALVVSIHLGVTRKSEPAVRLCTLMVSLGVVNFFLQKLGEGVAENAQFELLFAVAVGLGLAWTQTPHLSITKRYSPEAVRFAVVLAICVRLLASTRLEPFRLLVDPSFHHEIAIREEAMHITTAKIRAIHGDVIGSNSPTAESGKSSLACYRAGKPFFVDGFNLQQRIAKGELPHDVIKQRMVKGDLTLVFEDPLVNWSAKWSDHRR